jgi:hypothetical protein
MNLRNVTIWTTALLIIWTLFVPAYLMFTVQEWRSDAALLWLFFGLPLVVSFILSVALKYKTSTKILFVLTIVYGIWFAFIFCVVFLSFLEDPCGMQFLLFCIVGPLALPVMIPAWISAIVHEVRHRKRVQTETQS